MSTSQSPNPQEIVDREHLRLLAIFYYIVGGLTALFSSFGLLHFCFGLAIAFFPELFSGPGRQGTPPPFFGYLFSFVGGTIVLAGWTTGALTVYAGRSIQLRKRRMFSLIMAGVNCLNCTFLPFGVVLGVLSIMVLTRPSVIRAYDEAGDPPQGSDTPLS